MGLKYDDLRASELSPSLFLPWGGLLTYGYFFLSGFAVVEERDDVQKVCWAAFSTQLRFVTSF